MARGRKPGKKVNKTIKLSLPKKTYLILLGISGNNEQKLNRLIKSIIDEKLNNSTVKDLTKLIEPSSEEKPETEEITP